jgi:site-specific DNA recombinase
LEIIPDEAQIVKTIYSMYLSGYTTTEITADLYRKNYKSRTGIRFHSKLVCDILKNKVYTGKIVWNRKHYSKDKTKGGFGKGYRYLQGNDSDVIEADGEHDLIVSMDDFNRVQSRLALNRRPISRVFNKYQHLLTGILKCGLCGHNFFGSTYRSNHRTGIRKKWYRCSLKHQTKGIACNNKNIVAASYDQFALDVIEKIISHKIIKGRRFNELLKVVNEPGNEIIATLRDIERMLIQNQEKQKKLTQLFLNENISDEVFKHSQEPLKIEEEKIKKQVQLLEMKLVEKEDSQGYNKLLSTLLENFPRLRDNLKISEKKALLRLVFKKIVVTEGIIKEVELYEPFKQILSEVEIECQTKSIKPRMKQKDCDCAYARSDVR